MSDFKDSKTALVADVDCTADGQALCEKFGVRGYPSIKYGDPEDMKDYNGGRTLDDLKKFAEENLGPTCGPDNLDLCDEADKKLIAKYMKYDIDELDLNIEESDAKISKLDAKFQKQKDDLESKKTALSKKVVKEREKGDNAIAQEQKKAGYKHMKAVAAKRSLITPEKNDGIEEDPDLKEEL